MPKIKKQQRRKKFKANVNRKRLRNKLQKLPTIGCDEIKEAWEIKRSSRKNLEAMGLAYDPNEVLKIPSVKREFIQNAKRKMNGQETASDDEEEVPKGLAAKIHVAEKLEADAKAPRERMFRLPDGQVNFITYLMDKYGDDYKAMVRDRKNHYQLTWRQIRAKINTFKGIPEQYAEYLLKKGEIVLDDPMPLEETRRRIAEENVKKYCAPKKPKVTKKLWDIESLDGDESDKKNVFDDSIDENKNKENQNIPAEKDDSLKKLKLFSDDETDDEEQNKRKSKKAKVTANQKTAQDNKTKKKADDTKTSKPALKNAENKTSVSLEGNLKNRRRGQTLEKSQSSDSDSDDEEFEGEEEGTGFVNLSDMSEEELSEDDILDDGEFVTDSDDDSD